MEYDKKQGSGKGASFKRDKNTNGRSSGTGAGPDLGRLGKLGYTVQSVISHGAYISFGRTSDGGATIIRVLDNDTKLTSYCSNDLEIMEALAALEEEYKRPTLTLLPIPE